MNHHGKADGSIRRMILLLNVPAIAIPILIRSPVLEDIMIYLATELFDRSFASRKFEPLLQRQ